jgi:hypothetical protein
MTPLAFTTASAHAFNQPSRKKLPKKFCWPRKPFMRGIVLAKALFKLPSLADFPPLHLCQFRIEFVRPFTSHHNEALLFNPIFSIGLPSWQKGMNSAQHSMRHELVPPPTDPRLQDSLCCDLTALCAQLFRSLEDFSDFECSQPRVNVMIRNELEAISERA